MNTEQTANPIATGALYKGANPGVNAWLLIAVVAATLFAIRVFGPPNILDQDQQRPAAYVLDAVRNGNWICQRDWTGDITSKPPLYTWLAALVTLACGHITVFALYLPGALAGFGSALLVFWVGRDYFGARAAWFGALACLLTAAGAKQFGLARTDGVFAFTVTLAAFFAFRGWISGKGWTWFWLAAAAATLTKGPLGPLLAGFGLLAVVWERRSGDPLLLRGSQWLGITLYVLLVAGWFGLAYWQFRDALVAKMIGKELVGHAVSTGTRHLPGTLLYQQPLYYLGRAAPWSLLAFYGLWRTWRHPASDPGQRRLERFLFCWFTAGLLVFSLAPHQRADLLWPLMPAGALIAGRELEHWARRFAPARFDLWFGAAVAFGLIAAAFYYDVMKKKDPWVRQTMALKQMAQSIQQRGGSEFPITHVDSPMTLQVYLNTIRPPVSADRAKALLQGKEAAFVSLSDFEGLRALEQSGDTPTPHPPASAGIRSHQVSLPRLKSRSVAGGRGLRLLLRSLALARPRR